MGTGNFKVSMIAAYPTIVPASGSILP